MNKNALKETVAIAVRVEYRSDSDELYVVFEIVNEDLKKKIKQDWTQDIDFKLIDKNLIIDK